MNDAWCFSGWKVSNKHVKYIEIQALNEKIAEVKLRAL